MTTSITATEPTDLHTITVSKDDAETAVYINIERNRRIPIDGRMRVHPVSVQLNWVEAVLLRNALDKIINN
jgi:hypothetical protein